MQFERRIWVVDGGVGVVDAVLRFLFDALRAAASSLALRLDVGLEIRPD